MAEELSLILGWPPNRRAAEYLRKWVARGLVIRLRHENRYRYPLFQFGSDGAPLAVVQELIALYGNTLDVGWQVVRFLDRENHGLGDTPATISGTDTPDFVPARRPLEFLTADPAIVVAAARQDLGMSDGF